MKLTIKTLLNTKFQVDVEPEKTVRDLKETIEKEHGKDYPVASQKLIYSGKILVDDNKLSEYEFDEKKFLVLMISRPAPVPKPAAPEQSSSKNESEDKSKQARQSAETKPTPSVTAPTTTAANATQTATPTAPVNPNPTPTQPAAAHNPMASLMGAQGAAAALAEMSGLSMGESQISSRIAALMSQPHFRQMQDLIQQSPHLLASTIESLAQSDPEMYNFISENPDIFVSALNHPPMAGLRPSDGSASQQRPVGGGLSQQGGGGLGLLGQQPVMDQLMGNVTEHDKQAIERLKELGFSELLAVQAYVACDKDEQLAANLLFQMDQ